MRRFLISCAAGSLACATAFAAPADAGAVAFDATMNQLDKGGSTLYYTNIKDSMEQIQTALDYMAKIPAANSEDQLTPERVVKLIRVFSRVLNLEALHAMGSSVKRCLMASPTTALSSTPATAHCRGSLRSCRTGKPFIDASGQAAGVDDSGVRNPAGFRHRVELFLQGAGGIS
ncbi:MAG: hypothetical protein L6W00_22790 [Lentisphaeria bacterium]|nr:MAG: hypothetical protein L6W00_22790 [Lentisphaeria bacterium]